LLGTETAPENNAPTGEDTGKYTDARAPLGGPTRDAGARAYTHLCYRLGAKNNEMTGGS